MSGDCACDYSYVCPACAVTYELQARDARAINRIEKLEELVLHLLDQLGETAEKAAFEQHLKEVTQ